MNDYGPETHTSLVFPEWHTFPWGIVYLQKARHGIDVFIRQLTICSMFSDIPDLYMVLFLWDILLYTYSLYKPQDTADMDTIF